MELRNSILLPSNFTRTSITCQRCLINLNEGPASYKVTAAKKQTNFAKKIQAKIQSGKSLTKYQQKYSKTIKSFCGNQLVLYSFKKVIINFVFFCNFRQLHVSFAKMKLSLKWKNQRRLL